jgi:hypothetical protein
MRRFKSAWALFGSVGNRTTIETQNLECCGFESHLSQCENGPEAQEASSRLSTGRVRVRIPCGPLEEGYLIGLKDTFAAVSFSRNDRSSAWVHCSRT